MPRFNNTKKDNQASYSGSHTNHTKESPLFLLPVNNCSIVYLHVDMTGGMNLNKVFRSNCEWFNDKKAGKDCFEFFIEGNNESLLSQLTKRTIHIRERNDDREWIRDNTTTFIFTLRNPITRAVSAFNNDHPRNVPTRNGYAAHLRDIFYGKCFPTVEDLSIVLANKNDTKKVTVQDFRRKDINNTIDCFKIGTNVLKGNGHVLMNTHLSLNYEFYTAFSTSRFPKKEVLVIRTEELWNDIEALNHALGGVIENQTENIDDNKKTSSLISNETVVNDNKNDTSSLPLSHLGNVSHGSEKISVSSGLSKEGKAILCCYLSNENKLFEELVRCAVNLDKSEKESYLDQLYGDCGIPIKYRQQHGDRETFDWTQWRITNCPFP